MQEINTKKDLEIWLESDLELLPPVAVRSMDLTAYHSILMKKTLIDSLFLGCHLSDEIAGHIVNTGGIVIPNDDAMEFRSHIAHLYMADELFEGFDINSDAGYYQTRDYKIYKQYVNQGKDFPSSIHVSLMRRLHDHSVTEALTDEIAGRKVVAIMGGHGMERQDPMYLQVAQIARTLTRAGFLLVSGGGPGAMEATHVGAYFAARPESDMIAGIDMMKIRPEGAPEGKEYADKDWLHRAWKMRAAFPIPKGKEEDCKSIGIPTWLYGHEPPALFATHIAKYFANSVREEGLLAIALGGVIFAPGSAGTTQEIFQDACQNHYYAYNEDERVPRYVSPMILFGVEHWTTKRPVWGFLSHVAEGRPYGELLALTDDKEEIIQRIISYNMKKEAYRFPKVSD